MLRATTITGKLPLTGMTFPCHCSALIVAKLSILLTVVHCAQRHILDISQFVLWVNKMIAIIDITIHFQRKRTTAGWRKYTYLWR